LFVCCGGGGIHVTECRICQHHLSSTKHKTKDEKFSPKEELDAFFWGGGGRAKMFADK
jgi:hypothetical protein